MKTSIPRPSTIRHHARESVFAGGPRLYQPETRLCPPNLFECVLALEDCCEEAQAAEDILSNATADLKRLSKVLESQKIFLLIDEGTVRRYKSDLAEEIEPPITELIQRADKGLQSLNKLEAQSRAKLEAAKTRPARPRAGNLVTGKVEARRLHLLKRQREQIEEELQAMEEEVEELELKVLNS